MKMQKIAQRQYQGHVARKRFGQHFLVDQSVIDAMMATMAPQPDDYFVEIGAGLGALTAPLLDVVGTMHAIEIDRDLVKQLQKRFGAPLVLHSQDALTFDFNILLGEKRLQSQSFVSASTSASAPGQQGRLRPQCDIGQDAPLRIVGNLPYHLTSPLLFHLISYAPVVVDQYFMLQKEVVDRMIATSGSKAYGRLSVMLQYHYCINKLIDVAPTAFFPSPKVDSAVVKMVPRAQNTLPNIDYEKFSAIVRTAFSQRRKILRNTLADYRPQVDFDAIRFDLTRRAEEVSVEEYVTLAQHLTGLCA